MRSLSLQNRRDFLRISGEQRQKRGQREARVACEGRIDFLAILPSHVTRTSRSPRFRLCSPEIRNKIMPVLQASGHSAFLEVLFRVTRVGLSERRITRSLHFSRFIAEIVICNTPYLLSEINPV